jgi:thiamine pyrophosphate-dependent acetolactate synthase large subunit-like protein
MQEADLQHEAERADLRRLLPQDDDAFGGKGFFVEDRKDLRGTLDEAMNYRSPTLVSVVIPEGSARKPQQFRWHS